jgi:2-polyprenyl-3-methyl-5-hydroxy-6-metoxy-1,4-benzoquinol methylase
MQENQPYGNHSQLRWDVECLRQNRQMRSDVFPLSVKARSRIYPTRILRYWFVYHFLRIEYQQRAKAISVCEVGIGEGQMLQFMRSVAEIPQCDPVSWSSWIGVDRCVQQNALASLDYTRWLQEDIEASDSWMSGDYDAIVLLHVLEHLQSPEKALSRIVPQMKPGSVLIGGFPSVPNWCVALRQRQIRRQRDFRSNDHLSVFSPNRVQKMAGYLGMTLDFLAGAFFLRASGFFLENYAWWLRFNLAFGALFPSWPGEIYWVMRKPTD